MGIQVNVNDGINTYFENDYVERITGKQDGGKIDGHGRRIREEDENNKNVVDHHYLFVATFCCFMIKIGSQNFGKTENEIRLCFKDGYIVRNAEKRSKGNFNDNDKKK